METSPEKSETMAFLGQDPVICKISVHYKCLQQAKDFKYVGCETPCVNERDVQQKRAIVLQILGILNNTFTATLVQKFSRTMVHNALAPPLCYMEAKFET
jgi:hypothetical protein